MRQLLPIVLLASIAFAQPPDTLWTHVYPVSAVENLMALRQTSDGGFLMIGLYDSSGPAHVINAFLRKTDESGNVEWHRDYGGSEFDSFNDGLLTSDGGYLMVGSTESFGAVYGGAYVVRTN